MSIEQPITMERKTSERTAGDTSHSCPASCSPSRLHLDLFSGIGGFALAAQETGWQTIAFSEIDEYATKVLKRHWPNVPNLGDIRNVRNVRCDIITGGFPCQPYSLAGKRAGSADDRALWPEMCRVIAESKPRWVLGENVPGIINMELDRVLSDLESLGYAAWPVVLPACAVDARHRRDRVWIMAHSNSGGSRTLRQERGEAGQSISSGGSGERQDVANAASRESGKPTERKGRTCAGGRSANLGGDANSRLETAPDTESGGRHERHPHTGRSGKGKTAPQEWPRPADYCRWPAEPELGRGADGIPNRSHRLKGLGNAIVPQIATVIMREMVRMENAPGEPSGVKPQQPTD